MRKVSMLLASSMFLLSVCRIEAMQCITINNKMKEDAFIEGFETSGTIVVDRVKLVGEVLSNNKSETIQVKIASPSYLSEENYVILSLLNKAKTIEKEIKIAWGGDGVYLLGEHIVNGFFRIAKQYDGRGNVTFTICDYDDSAAIEQLKKNYLNRWKKNSISQQKQANAVIANAVISKQSGLTSDEINAWNLQ